MSLICIFCGWTGEAKSAIHLNEDELKVLKDILYKESFITGKWHKIKNYNDFLLEGGHICPICSGWLVDINKRRDELNTYKNNLIRSYQ